MQKVSEFISTLRNSKYLGLIAILALVAIIPITVLVAQMNQDIRQRASEVSLSPVSPPSTTYPNVSFDLSPTTITKTTSDAPFQAQITVKAGTNNVTGLDFTLVYNQNVLELTGFSPVTTNSFSTQLVKTTDSTAGTLRYSAINMQGALTGDILVGTLTFRPKALGSSPITFSTIKLTVLNYNQALFNSNKILGTYIVVAPAPISTAPTQIPVLGDANGDRVVDILDYNIWRDEYTGILSTKRADFNNDGIVDLTDFNIWRNAANPVVPTPTTSVASPTPTIRVASPTPIASVSKRVFVTSTIYSGDLRSAGSNFGLGTATNGLDGADKICQGRANITRLGGTWKAWLSDNTTSAANRLTHANIPYKGLNGVTIASNWADLTDGNLQNPILMNEVRSYNGNYVWTGTKHDGTIINPGSSKCLNWTSSTDFSGPGAVGQSGYTDFHWSWNSSYSCSRNFSLYCFEQ